MYPHGFCFWHLLFRCLPLSLAQLDTQLDALVNKKRCKSPPWTNYKVQPTEERKEESQPRGRRTARASTQEFTRPQPKPKLCLLRRWIGLYLCLAAEHVGGVTTAAWNVSWIVLFLTKPASASLYDSPTKPSAPTGSFPKGECYRPENRLTTCCSATLFFLLRNLSV